MLEHGCNVLLTSPQEPCALVNAILEVINDCELRSRLIGNGYEFATDHLGQGESATQVVGLILRDDKNRNV